ncbi:MAG: hypothetical protein ACFN38_01705 [Campylobacter sp.]
MIKLAADRVLFWSKFADIKNTDVCLTLCEQQIILTPYLAPCLQVLSPALRPVTTVAMPATYFFKQPQTFLNSRFSNLVNFVSIEFNGRFLAFCICDKDGSI